LRNGGSPHRSPARSWRWTCIPAERSLLEACFLDVVASERIVFTNALIGGYRPAVHGFMTAVISFKDHPEGTAYESYAMHKDKADRDKHEEMGFHDGWGTVAAQLAALVEPRS
jgi:uncharacterized protein YndB with AHSA1/START domain